MGADILRRNVQLKSRLGKIVGILHSFWFLSFKISSKDFLELAIVESARANHSYKLYVKAEKVNCYKYSFCINIVNFWNGLPKKIVEADSFEFFKSKLK